MVDIPIDGGVQQDFAVLVEPIFAPKVHADAAARLSGQRIAGQPRRRGAVGRHHDLLRLDRLAARQAHAAHPAILRLNAAHPYPQTERSGWERRRQHFGHALHTLRREHDLAGGQHLKGEAEHACAGRERAIEEDTTVERPREIGDKALFREAQATQICLR